MNGPLFFAVLMVLVLAFGVAMFWQESKRMRQNAAIYGVEDSIEWIWEGLGDGKRDLRKGDVRRILEWEMHYLQQPDVWKDDGAAVVGGLGAATYVQEQSLAQGHAYSPEQIFAVLDLQATYLQAIGAIGDPVETDGNDA